MSDTDLKPTLIAVDIGGTKVSVALVRAGNVLEFRTERTPQPAEPDPVLSLVWSMIAGWATDANAIGIASAGGVSSGRVTGVSRSILRGWVDVPVQEYFTQRSGLPTAVTNDGQAAAWGEYRYGAGRGTSDLAFITVSTGIGGGLVSGGRLLTGATGIAGHLGHVTVDPNGPRCSCGRRGCVEQVASGSAIAREATALFGRPHTTEQVFEAAAEDEPWARAIIQESVTNLAAAIATIRMVLDPELVVIGGGVGLAKGYIDRLHAALRTSPMTRELRLAPAALGATAGLSGAADLAETLIAPER